MEPGILGIVFALSSAAVWGAGDFSGGMAARRINQYQVLTLASLAGVVMLLLFFPVWGEGLPSPMNVLWGVLAGAVGAIGVAGLYRALGMGYTASVAPTAALIGSALPVLFAIITEGLPKYTQLAGFGVALMGIWLVSRSPRQGEKRFKEGMNLAFFSGVCFGGFFILISQVEKGQVIGPSIMARIATLVAAWIVLRIKHLPMPKITSNPVAILAGLLDTGGNILYLMAIQYTRIDVAVILAGLYPAGTVILATIILKEKVSLAQWAGAGFCLLAIGLITV